MLKWFILTVAVLLSIIGVLGWRLANVSALRIDTSVAQPLLTNEVQAAHAFTEAQVKDLFHKRGCVNCHDSKNTLVGPPFNAIAERYEADLHAGDTLLTSLREGSKGKWGAAAMPSYTPQSVSSAEAEAMLEWILEMP